MATYTELKRRNRTLYMDGPPATTSKHAHPAGWRVRRSPGQPDLDRSRWRIARGGRAHAQRAPLSHLEGHLNGGKARRRSVGGGQ
eukprot:352597-Chlamydomonas_euryale.AAC.12